MFDPKLTGKVAIVTGVSSSIGQAVVRRLALGGVKVALATQADEIKRLMGVYTKHLTEPQIA